MRLRALGGNSALSHSLTSSGTVQEGHMGGIKLPENWQKSLNEHAASQSARLSVLMSQQPENTPRNAELTPFDRHRAWHRIGLSGTTDNYISGWIYSSETFKNSKTVLCWEACTGSIHLGTFLSLMKASLTEKCTKRSFVALPLAKVTQGWGKAEGVEWVQGHYQRAGLDDGEDAAKNPWADEQLFLLPQVKVDVMENHRKQDAAGFWERTHKGEDAL